MGVELMIAGISASLEAVQTWLTLRNRREAAAIFDATLTAKRAATQTREQNRVLLDLIPFDILKTMEERTRRCWERYHEVLRGEGDYLPEEVDEATRALKRCICRELQRIIDLNGSLPPGDLRAWWNAYCETRSG